MGIAGMQSVRLSAKSDEIRNLERVLKPGVLKEAYDGLTPLEIAKIAISDYSAYMRSKYNYNLPCTSIMEKAEIIEREARLPDALRGMLLSLSFREFKDPKEAIAKIAGELAESSLFCEGLSKEARIGVMANMAANEGYRQEAGICLNRALDSKIAYHIEDRINKGRFAEMELITEVARIYDTFVEGMTAEHSSKGMSGRKPRMQENYFSMIDQQSKLPLDSAVVMDAIYASIFLLRTGQACAGSTISERLSGPNIAEQHPKNSGSSIEMYYAANMAIDIIAKAKRQAPEGEAEYLIRHIKSYFNIGRW